ncbi:class I SAM-dependent methyltransferase [Aestuariispira ectoiniformans]|uniref:class I SAM-dependent methyltransferase n=1 Tax=Aestuariispira ectoiniformans TaxID=2775080 RepID=UPI00223B5BAC|nr:class I SAM-dependent methyltransferase [Aestuariispira ectoiniformans]
MFSKLTAYYNTARSLPLPAVFAKALRKTGFDSYTLQRIDFLYAKEFQRPEKAAKILFDACKLAGVDFSYLIRLMRDKTVLEIGCGPHGGTMPLALVAGAKNYIGVDPLFNEQLFSDIAAGGRYLETALPENASFLRSNVPGIRTQDVGPQSAMPKVSFKKGGISQRPTDEPHVDLVVSISCLEHIHDFSKAARDIANISKDTIHFHIVNFSNHLYKDRPFAELYEMPMHEFSKKWKGNINGLRMFEMAKIFEEAGLALNAIPLDMQAQALPTSIAPWWTERYSQDELSIRTAILTNIDFPN